MASQTDEVPCSFDFTREKTVASAEYFYRVWYVKYRNCSEGSPQEDLNLARAIPAIDYKEVRDYTLQVFFDNFQRFMSKEIERYPCDTPSDSPCIVGLECSSLADKLQCYFPFLYPPARAIIAQKMWEKADEKEIVGMIFNYLEHQYESQTQRQNNLRNKYLGTFADAQLQEIAFKEELTADDMEYLVQNPDKAMLKDDRGNTLINVFAARGMTHVLKMLDETGIPWDWENINNGNLTALGLAFLRLNPDCYRYLCREKKLTVFLNAP